MIFHQKVLKKSRITGKSPYLTLRILFNKKHMVDNQTIEL